MTRFIFCLYVFEIQPLFKHQRKLFRSKKMTTFKAALCNDHQGSSSALRGVARGGPGGPEPPPRNLSDQLIVNPIQTRGAYYAPPPPGFQKLTTPLALLWSCQSS